MNDKITYFSINYFIFSNKFNEMAKIGIKRKMRPYSNIYKIRYSFSNEDK